MIRKCLIFCRYVQLSIDGWWKMGDVALGWEVYLELRCGRLDGGRKEVGFSGTRLTVTAFEIT